MVLVSHDRDEVFRLSDSIAVVSDGSIDAVGSKSEVFHNPQTRMGAMLTGCKNISAVEILDENHIRATDWGLTLEVPEIPADTKAVGVRMHDIRPGAGKNTFRCRVVEEIENPFSYTILLQRVNSTGASPIGWELEKAVWNKLRAPEIGVCLPPEALLLLKDERK